MMFSGMTREGKRAAIGRSLLTEASTVGPDYQWRFTNENGTENKIEFEYDPDGEGPLESLKVILPIPESKLFWVSVGWVLGVLSVYGYDLIG